VRLRRDHPGASQLRIALDQTVAAVTPTNEDAA
jgi:hypothetical protein